MQITKINKKTYHLEVEGAIIDINGGKKMKDIEFLRQKFIEGLKFHGADFEWVKTANMREIDGIVYIQTEGHDYTFPKGKWENIENLISIL